MSTILTVGAGQQYQTIGAAIAAANAISGGVDIQVTAGTYTNDGGAIANNAITIEGVGGVAKLVGTLPEATGAILDVLGNNVSLENLDLSGATGGAGIVLASGSLELSNVSVHDNKQGVVAGDAPSSTLLILHSDIFHNGSATGGANVNAGAIAVLSVSESQVHDAVGGPEISSAAQQTTIAGSVLADNGSNATVSLALPAGGQVILSGDTIEKGANSTGTSMVAWNASGTALDSSSMLIDTVTLVNDVFPNTDTFSNGTIPGLSSDYTGSKTWNLPNLGTAITGAPLAALSSRPALPSSASVYAEQTPAIAIVTGNRDGTVTLAGRFGAGERVTVAGTAHGQTTLLGSAVTAANGWWSVTSGAKIDPATVNTYTVSGINETGTAVSMPGALVLTDTGADHLASTPGVANVFAIMSFKGSDIIDGFKTSAAGPVHDVIDFSGRGITNFAQVQAMMSGSASTVLTLSGGKSVTLAGIAPTTLSAADFVYS